MGGGIPRSRTGGPPAGGNGWSGQKRHWKQDARSGRGEAWGPGRGPRSEGGRGPGSQKGTGFPEATVSQGGGSGQPGQVPPGPRQRIWLLVGHSSLYKGHREEKPLWKGLSREGAEEGEEAVWGEQRGEREPRWGHSARVEIPHERACEHAACARECVHAGACVSVCWRCAVYAVVLHMCVYVLVCAAH